MQTAQVISTRENMPSAQIPIMVTPYQAADARGDLIKLARLGRSGDPHPQDQKKKLHVYRKDSLIIYVDDAMPFFMVIDGDSVVCTSIDKLLVPGPWLDRALALEAAL